MRPKPDPHPLSKLARRAHRTAVHRRWIKRGIVGGAFLLVVGVGGLYLARGALTRSLALSRLESALGYEAECSSAEILPSGHVSLPGLSLRAPGVDGEAGEILVARRVELAIDWTQALFSPSDAVTSVRLIDPVFRVSVDVESAELNLGSGGGGGASTPGALPPVSVERARLVFGEHGEGWFAPLHEIAISGSMRPHQTESGVYELQLTEEALAGRSPAVLEGEIDLRDGDGRLALRDVDFAALRSAGVRPRVETLLRRLRIGGRLPLATLRYESDGSFLIKAELTNVDVLAPVPVRNPEAAGVPDQLMNLSGVTGLIEIKPSGLEANLVGLFEDLDARVIIETDGFSPSADASAEVVISDYRWGPTPALLPFAPGLAAEFVQRFSGPEATINGRVRVAQENGVAGASGIFTWRDGSAAFEDFAYPLSGINGRMTFDGTGVYITEMRGVGPTGADVGAQITAVPPGDDAEIEANIVAVNVPADRYLFEAIGGARGETLAELFTGESSHGVTPGGTLRLEIDVYKRGGEHGEWGWDVRAESPELGIRAAKLGYPLFARGFSLALDREDAVAEIADLAGPTGLRGRARVEVPMRGSSGLSPSGTFEIDEAPVDDLLLSAVTTAMPEAGEALEGRRVAGTVGAVGSFTINENGDPDVLGDVVLRGVSVRSARGDAGLEGINGTLSLGAERIQLAARGEAAGGVAAEVEGQLQRESGAWSMSASLDGANFTPEAQRAVASLHEGVGEAFSGAVEEWGLGGRVNAFVSLASAGGGLDEGVEWSVDVTDFSEASLALDGQRVELDGTRGVIGVSADGLRFDGVRATARVDASSVGELGLEGRTPSAGEDTRLAAAGRGVRLESPVVRALATRWGGDGVKQAVSEADPAGVADVSVEVLGRADGAVAVSGRLEPRSLEITRDGSRASFSEATGAAVFDAGGLRFEGLRLRADGWDLLLDGAYREGSGFTGEVDMTAEGMSPDLLASLPADAAGAVRAIELEIGEGGELWATGDVGDASELVIGFREASFTLGAPVDRATGRLTLRQDDEGRRVGELDLETFRAATVPMARGRARLEWSEDQRTVHVPYLEAECAGGVIRGQARLAPTDGHGTEREYLVDVRCADVPLAWIVERPEGEARPEASLPARGLIGGQLRVRGIVGGDGSRRVGRGFFTINGGEVVRLPLLTPVFELMNLQPPVGERLTDAAIEFGLAGDRLIFDRLYVQSDSLVVSAAGEARLDTGTLDLAVRTHGRARIWLLSDLIDAFKDQLLGARITGPIREPEYELVQLPNAGRVLLGAIAPGAGGRVDKAAPPARPALADHVPSTLEPIDE